MPPSPPSPDDRFQQELAYLRERLSRTATVVDRDVSGAGSERGYTAVVCLGCNAGRALSHMEREYDVAHIQHERWCPLNPDRYLPVSVATLARLLQERP